MLTGLLVPVAFRNKCERATGPKPEPFQSIFPGVNATRTSGTGLERDRNANRNRCEQGLIAGWITGALPRGSEVVSTTAGHAGVRGSIPGSGAWQNLALYIKDCVSLCHPNESLKAAGPFYLVSMPGEV